MTSEMICSALVEMINYENKMVVKYENRQDKDGADNRKKWSKFFTNTLKQYVAGRLKNLEDTSYEEDTVEDMLAWANDCIDEYFCYRNRSLFEARSALLTYLNHADYDFVIAHLGK